jgi:hypothetical protein
MQNRTQIDKALKKRGFGGLEDKNLIHQVAMCIRDHEHFRQILCAIEPEKRTDGYETMRPYLRFDAKPLHVYMAEAADLAARKEAAQTALDVLAEKAIARNIADETKKGVLTLKCSMCTREFVFPGRDVKEAEDTARKDGWRIPRFQESAGIPGVFCPACAKLRAEFSA